MLYKEIAGLIKKKAPYYEKVDDVELVDRIIERNPIALAKIIKEAYPYYQKVDDTALITRLKEKLSSERTTFKAFASGTLKGILKPFGDMGLGLAKISRYITPVGMGGVVAEKVMAGVSGLPTPSDVVFERQKKLAEETFSLTPEEIKSIDKNFGTQVASSVIQALGMLPAYVVASKLTGPAAFNLLGTKLASLVPGRILPSLMRFLVESTHLGTAFGGLSVVEGIGAEKPIGEITKEVGIAYTTAPGYVLGGGIGRGLGRVLVGKPVEGVGYTALQKVGQKASESIGSGVGFATATGLSGGDIEAIAESAVVGVLLPLLTPRIGAERARKVENEIRAIKESKELTPEQKNEKIVMEVIKEPQIVEVIKDLPKRELDLKLEVEKVKREAQELKKEAITDELTGTLNRRGVFEKVKEIENADVVVFDIDHFKRRQDARGGHEKAQPGHIWGDAVLKQTAELANSVAQQSGGFMGRIGGEEFVVIVPKGLGKTTAENLVEVFRKTPIGLGADKEIVTISAGYGPLVKEHGKEFSIADSYLYQAKRTGRDRAVGQETQYIETPPTVETKPTPATEKTPEKISVGLYPELITGGGAGVEPRGISQQVDGIIRDFRDKYLAPGVVSTKKGGYSLFEKIKYKLRNKFYPAQRFMEPLTPEQREFVEKVVPIYDPFAAARNMDNVLNMVAVTLGISGGKHPGGTFRLTATGVEFTGKPLRQIIEPYARNLDDICTIWLARRMVELYENRQAAELQRLQLPQEVLTEYRGVTAQDYQNSKNVLEAIKLKYGENYQKLYDVTTELHNFETRAILEPLRQWGKISDEKFEALAKTFHAPMERLFEEFAKTEDGRIVLREVNDMLKPFKGSERKILDPLMTLIKRVIITQAWCNRQRVIESLCKVNELFPDKTASSIRVLKPGESARYTVTRWVNGESIRYALEDGYLYNMIMKTPQDLGLVVKLLEVPAAMMHAGSVLSFSFAQRNPLRDAQQFLIYSQKKIKLSDYKETLVALLNRTEEFQKFLILGSGGAFYENLGTTRAEWLKAVKGQRDLGVYFRDPLKALKQLGLYGENLNRVSEFIKLLNDVGAIRAGMAARDVTTDFGVYGAEMGFVRKTVPFFTAQIAGLEKFVREMRQKPIKTTLKAMCVITVPKLVEYALFNDDERWQNLPNWRKLLFINIPTNNKKIPFITIPTAWELGLIFGGIPMMYMDYLKNKDPKLIQEWSKQLLASLLPGTYGLPVPQAFIPVLEHAANWRFFFERPMMSPALKELPPEMQYTERTLQVFKALGDVLKISPIIAENYFIGYTGGLGRDAVKLAEDLILKHNLVGKKELEQIEDKIGYTYAESPFLRGVVGKEAIGLSSKWVDYIYKDYGEAKKYYQAAKALEKGRDIDREKYKEYIYKARYYDVLTDAVEQLRTFRNERVAIINSKLDKDIKEKKLRKIDEAITQYARMIYEVLHRAKK